MLKIQPQKLRKICINCGRALPSSWTEPMCEKCTDSELYQKVKDYILKHDVTAFQVADHFDIPLEKVKLWIKEGYIEYRPDNPFPDKSN